MYLIFDVEGVYDRSRVMAWANAPGETPEETFDRLTEKGTKLSVALSRPVVVTMLVVDAHLQYVTHVNLADRTGCNLPHQFWSMVEQGYANGMFKHMVTFAGSAYDVPVLEMAGLACGASMGWWMNAQMKRWDSPRLSGMGPVFHWDLKDILATKPINGATMSFWSRMAGWPGKVDTAGDQVEALLAKPLPDDGTDPAMQQLIDYCTCDVLNTYGVLQMYLHAGMALERSHRGPLHPLARTVVQMMTAGRGQECQTFVRLCQNIEANELF